MKPNNITRQSFSKKIEFDNSAVSLITKLANQAIEKK